MAGPLGEMFDHGKKQPILLYNLFVNGVCSQDAMLSTRL